MSLRKSSRSRNGSKSEVLPKPKARRRCTPAPSRVGLDLMSRLTGRMDMGASWQRWARGHYYTTTAELDSFRFREGRCGAFLWRINLLARAGAGVGGDTGV